MKLGTHGARKLGRRKTTLVEAMLFEGGIINRRGDVKARTLRQTITSWSKSMQLCS